MKRTVLVLMSLVFALSSVGIEGTVKKHKKPGSPAHKVHASGKKGNKKAVRARHLHNVRRGKKLARGEGGIHKTGLNPAADRLHKLHLAALLAAKRAKYKASKTKSKKSIAERKAEQVASEAKAVTALADYQKSMASVVPSVSTVPLVPAVVPSASTALLATSTVAQMPQATTTTTTVATTEPVKTDPVVTAPSSSSAVVVVPPAEIQQ